MKSGWSVEASLLQQAKAEIPTLQTYRKGSGEKIPDWGILERSIYGVDVSRQMMRIAMMNLVLHGIRHANVKRANALSDMGGLTEDDLNRRYKVILSNPPFAGVLPGNRSGRTCPPTLRRASYSSLGVMMEALAPGGQCAVVVPEGLLFGSTSAHVELRRKLVEDYDLLAVVSLPAGVFKPYAGVKTGVLVFRRPSSGCEERQEAQHKERFGSTKSVPTGLTQTKFRVVAGPKHPSATISQTCFANGPGIRNRVSKTSLASKPERYLPAGSDEPRCWWATIKAIAENDYNLAAGRYKPQIAEKAPDEDPAELIRETLAIEREIADGLEKLLQEREASE